MTSATVPILSRLRLAALDIKLSHTVFALPFALLAAFLAAAHGPGDWPKGSAGPTVHLPRLPGWGKLALLVLCMVFARTAAMAVNRWADAALDAANPRTAGRAVPSGRLSARFMLGVALAAGALFIASAGGFLLAFRNPWPLALAPLVLAWLCLYSYTKRFTWLCHVVLGSALALSPLAATIAVQPGSLRLPQPWLLAGMVMCWVAGFDIIYALQDVAVDRLAGLHSMPARLGVEPALWISRGLHLLAVAALVSIWKVDGLLGPAFLVGVTITTGLLILEHALVWGSKTHRIHIAFFTINGVISVLLGTLGVAEVVLGVR